MAPPHSFWRICGSFFLRIILLDTPFKLLANCETAILGGSRDSGCD